MLLVIVLLNRFATGMLKATAILIGIVVGYVVAAFSGMVNFDTVANAAWFSVPMPFMIKPLFRSDIIFPFFAVYVVAGLETMGNANGITISAFGREATAEEISGGIISDAISCAFAGIFNVLPNTAFGQNVGIIAMTKVINRFCIAMGAIVLILAITLGLGFGVGNLSDSVKENFPAVLHFIFAEPVASVCIVSVLACLLLKPEFSKKAAEK